VKTSANVYLVNILLVSPKIALVSNAIKNNVNKNLKQRCNSIYFAKMLRLMFGYSAKQNCK
jgi:hypothetical protein